MATPYSLKLYDEVTSTQDVAAADFGGEPLLVVAARQTEGRGRSHRRWQQAPRAVAASLAFVPDWPSRSWPLIPLVAGLAAGETLGEGVRLKWPNDLLWGEAGKVGGVLVEGTSARLVVGLGVNLWWPEPPEGIRGLRDDDPGPELGRVLAEAWARNLLHRLARGPLDWDREGYVAISATLGRWITWEPGGEGRAVDIDEDGALVVESGESRVRLVAGEVRHVRDRW